MLEKKNIWLLEIGDHRKSANDALESNGSQPFSRQGKCLQGKRCRTQEDIFWQVLRKGNFPRECREKKLSSNDQVQC